MQRQYSVGGLGRSVVISRNRFKENRKIGNRRKKKIFPRYTVPNLAYSKGEKWKDHSIVHIVKN